ncbi:MAG TPA: GntR family transcriptional regulator [Clostridia bacterium]|nr:GntR family transcriptional regulator [Clostridia bacterium]
MKKVNKNSPLPLYYQLKDIICDLIENEELKPNDPIPPERELCEYHGVSRMTVNKAITNLVNEGLLYREQGKGTFVAKPKEGYQLSKLLSFTEDMKAKGLQVDTRIISFHKKSATKKIQKVLNLLEKEEVFEIKRLRLIAGEPYAIETAYLPVSLCEDLTMEKLDKKSLYDILLSEYGLKMDYAHQTIEAVILDEYESEILQVQEKSIALMFSRKTYLEGDRPMELTKAVYRGDKYKFEVVLRR